MFAQFDLTGRPKRKTQEEALKFLSDNWDKSDVFALNLPTGAGKSAILRAIQVEFPGTPGLIPTNILIDQYRDTYKNINYIKGVDHYECEEYPGYNCSEAKELYKSECLHCVYTNVRDRAKAGESTIFNPMSFYYYLNRMQEAPEVIVVDEAHKLLSFMSLMVDMSFRKGKFPFEQIKDMFELQEWLDDTIRKVTDLIKKYKIKNEVVKVKSQFQYRERLRFLQDMITKSPENFVFYIEERSYRGRKDKYLVVKPVAPPIALLRKLLCSKKIILLSATLLEPTVWKFGYTSYLYKDFPSEIPVENRKVLYKPGDENFNYKTEPETVANYIRNIISKHEGENALVHVSYAWAGRLAEFFPDAIFHSQENKIEMLEKFKKSGGVFFAAGFAEGLDLYDDLCRVIIIPLILKANPTDPLYIKQVSLEGGYLRSKMDCLEQVIQQCGRASRHINDFSVTYVGDKYFPKLINETRKYIPKSFIDAIKWSAA